MAEQSSFYNRLSTSSTNELDLEPPRSRIAVACNRCRRRKIKCSGSIYGGSCEGCTRANDAECVFADRPHQNLASRVSQPSSSGMPTDMQNVQMQPLGPPRSSSLPGAIVSTAQNDRQFPFRTMSGTSRGSMTSTISSSPSRYDARSDGRSSPVYPISPVAQKRQSNLPYNHPYQRPASVGKRQNSSDSINSGITRYSQSLMQAQSQQLGNGRSQMRTYSMPAPTSNPQTYNNVLNLQPHTEQVPHFTQPDYDHAAISPVTMEFNAPPDYNPQQHARSVTPETQCYSPVYAPSIYSASTPELLSSDSVSTLESRSSNGIPIDRTMYRQMPYMNQAYGYTLQQPMYTSSYSYYEQPTSGIMTSDPSQWTPGADKLAKQYIDFATTPTSGHYSPAQ